MDIKIFSNNEFPDPGFWFWLLLGFELLAICEGIGKYIGGL